MAIHEITLNDILFEYKKVNFVKKCIKIKFNFDKGNFKLVNKELGYLQTEYPYKTYLKEISINEISNEMLKNIYEQYNIVNENKIIDAEDEYIAPVKFVFNLIKYRNEEI